MHTSRLLIAILIVVALGVAGCGAGSALRTWYVDSLTKVFPDDKPGANERSGNTWLVARNGHLSVQIALRTDKAIAQLRAEVKAPENSGRKLTAEARWGEYVPV